MKKFLMLLFLPVYFSIGAAEAPKATIFIKNETPYEFDFSAEQTAGPKLTKDQGWGIIHTGRISDDCKHQIVPLYWLSLSEGIAPPEVYYFDEVYYFQGRITYDKDHFIGLNQLLYGAKKALGIGSERVHISLGGQPLSAAIEDKPVTKEFKTWQTTWSLPDPSDPSKTKSVKVLYESVTTDEGQINIFVTLKNS